jgi:hypothetical protein
MSRCVDILTNAYIDGLGFKKYASERQARGKRRPCRLPQVALDPIRSQLKTGLDLRGPSRGDARNVVDLSLRSESIAASKNVGDF